jgi:hypothetical protein
MILVLGVWAFVRALLVNSAAVSLENVALRHQLSVLQRSVRALDFVAATASSGSGSRGCGPAGGPASSLFSPRQFSLGIAKVSSSTGAGSPGAAQRVARRSILSSAP